MQKRKLASNLILFLFFIVVCLAAIFSDVFQNPIKNATQMIEQTKLFSSNDLILIKRISLKNKSGEFIFERNEQKENNQMSPWHMVSPRDISANSVFIEKLFNALTVIKVKKLFADEKVNISNFSIDKPTSTLNLYDESARAITINVGLMNTIDNSTYLKITGRPGIYHVEAPSVSLENVNINDLIESQIFPIDLKSIAAARIFKGKKGGIPILEIKKKDANWINSEGLILASEKVEEYLGELTNLKSSFIMDQPNETQKKQMANLLKNSYTIVSFEDSNNTTIDYHISGVTKEMSDLDLKNEEFFLITTNANATTYVVKKEFLDLFNRKIETMKAIVAPPKAPLKAPNVTVTAPAPAKTVPEAAPAEL